MMRILIGYDGSESADTVLNDLRQAGLPREAEAMIVSVGEAAMMPPPSSYELVGTALTSRRVTSAIAHSRQLTAQALEAATGLAAEARERVRSFFPGWEVRAEGLAGKPSWELIKKADEWNPDLVVVGSRGRSALGRFFLGSVSRNVVTDSHHSVRVARVTEESRVDAPPKVMIGVDGSVEAERAVRSVGGRVWPEGTEVRIIAVDEGIAPARIADIPPTRAEMMTTGRTEEGVAPARRMVEWAADELSAIGLRVSTAIEQGDPRRVLVEEAHRWDADSIFVGARRFSSALERFRLGSVSTALVTKAHCSVEVVRGAEEVEL